MTDYDLYIKLEKVTTFCGLLLSLKDFQSDFYHLHDKRLALIMFFFSLFFFLNFFNIYIFSLFGNLAT